jgi:hypothetical protein
MEKQTGTAVSFFAMPQTGIERPGAYRASRLESGKTFISLGIIGKVSSPHPLFPEVSRSHRLRHYTVSGFLLGRPK